MKYKVGDKVILYTWQEMVDKFGTDKYDDIKLNTEHWSKCMDSEIPTDRVVTIDHFDSDDDPCFGSDRFDWFQDEMIKCSANEYYLQQIKEEMNEEV